jgi:hypothetical protein
MPFKSESQRRYFSRLDFSASCVPVQWSANSMIEGLFAKLLL